ncbi:MAG: hypothetical protein WD942_05985 [Dehalococcoidia bacterium]
MQKPMRLLVLLSLVLIPTSARAQVNFEYRSICGGTAFVFCASIRYEQMLYSAPERPFFSRLQILNESGGGVGYRGAVITEVRFEGIDQRDEYAWGLEGDGFDPGPLHTDALDGEVLLPTDTWAFWGTNMVPGTLSFRRYQGSFNLGDEPPWSLRGGGRQLVRSGLAAGWRVDLCVGCVWAGVGRLGPNEQRFAVGHFLCKGLRYDQRVDN